MFSSKPSRNILHLNGSTAFLRAFVFVLVFVHLHLVTWRGDLTAMDLSAAVGSHHPVLIWDIGLYPTSVPGW
jgi:predicted membrane protein